MKHEPRRYMCLLIALGLMWSGQIVAQQQYVDSLDRLLQEMALDTHRVNALNDLAYYLGAIDPQRARQKAKEALGLALQLGHWRGITKAHYMAAYAAMQMGSYEEALDHARRCRDLCIQSGLNYRLPSAWTLIGSIYRQMSLHEQAVDAFLSAAELTKKWGDTLDLAYAWVNLATAYIDLGQRPQARELLQRAGPVFRQYGEMRTLVDTWINLGATDLEVSEKMRYLRQAISVAEELGYSSALAYAWHNLGGGLLDSLNQVEEATEAFARAVQYSREAGDAFEETTACIDLGKAWVLRGVVDSARWYLQRGLSMASSLGNRQLEADALEGLAMLTASNGSYARAYAYQTRRLAVMDTLFNVQLSEKLAEANARYESEKKEARIAAQQLEIERQRNTRNLVIALALIALLLTATILQRRYYRQRRMKEQAEIAARKEAEQAELLRQLDEQKTAFFSYLAHELRTPLTLLLGPLEEALGALRQPSLEKPLQTALRQANQLLMLVNQILDMVRHDAGQLEKRERSVVLTSFFASLYDSVVAAARKKDIALDWEVAPALQGLWQVDDDKLRHILYNLLSNALKFTPSGGKVALKAEVHGGHLHVSVHDSGPGIPAEVQERIFERYYQTEEGKKRGGTGLGLAWAAELARFLGGSLEVASQPEQGAAFHLAIPLEGAQENAQIATDEAATQPSAATRAWDAELVPRILVVEDNPEMADFLKHLLDPPMVVQTVFNGREAIDWLERHEAPDLIISDVMMPEMDGFELLEAVRKRATWQGIPFIFLTASSTDQDVLKGLTLGVDDFLLKPFHPAEVVARVRNAVRRSWNRKMVEPEPAPEHGTELSADEALLERARQAVLDHIDQPDFRVAELAEALNYSKRQLSRIIRRLTGMTPVEFTLEIRLQKAMELLRQGKYATVSEVRFEVGIESASYFTTKFRERFGIRPSEVRQAT